MGAYSPVPFVESDLVDRVMEEAVRPTLDALRSREIPYRGVLYAGIMLTPEGPKVLEYNVRFGDPECQVVLPRLASDLAMHCLESATGNLSSELRFGDDAAVTVVLASEGYPQGPRTGDVIEGIEAAEELPGVTVFHAGTQSRDGNVATAGGRVLDVTAVADTLAKARTLAYDAVSRITWPGMQFRRDIAEKAS
jgi:phosphoribosylamine--glycine ligase